MGMSNISSKYQYARTHMHTIYSDMPSVLFLFLFFYCMLCSEHFASAMQKEQQKVLQKVDCILHNCPKTIVKHLLATDINVGHVYTYTRTHLHKDAQKTHTNCTCTQGKTNKANKNRNKQTLVVPNFRGEGVYEGGKNINASRTLTTYKHEFLNNLSALLRVEIWK